MASQAATLSRIRRTISALEAQIASLRLVEHNLETSSAPPAPATTRGRRAQAPAAKTPAKPAAKPAARPARATGAQPLIEAIADVLDSREHSSVAAIADRLKEAGRDVNTRAISFALQALKKKNLAKKAVKGWLRAGRRPKPPAKAAAESAPVKVDPAPASKAPAPRKAAAAKPVAAKPVESGGKRTVADIVASVLQRSGPLPLSDLMAGVKGEGRAVSSGTLSNTLQIMKKKGSVESADGKWKHAGA